MIQRTRKRIHTAPGHTAIGRFQPNAAAERGRFADRSCRIGADRGITKPRGDCGRRSSRRSPGAVAERPGIVDIAKKTDQRASTVSKLVQVVLANDDGTGLLEPANHLRIFHRNSVFVQRAARRRAHARGVNQILQRNRNAMQRAAPLATGDLRLGCACGVEG